LHSEEHLATSDQGIVMLRRVVKKQIEITMTGGDPSGVICFPAQQIVKVEGGNFFFRPGVISCAKAVAVWAASGAPAPCQCD
jgi:hypothetical protein